MLTKKLLPAAVATTLLAGAAAVQAGDISGNVTLTTDYRFRGISQSNEDPTVQGGLDYAFENGIYVGTWGSGVDFGGGDYGSLELDYYVGWSGDITENTSIDVGYLYYDYPGDDGDVEGDYGEVYGSITWRGLTGGIAYSNDYYAETDTFYYYYADYGISFGADDMFSLGFHVGYNDLEEDGGFLSSDEDSYVDYSVTLGASWMGVDWALAYVGTDLDEEDYFDTDLAEDTVVFSITKSM